MMEVNQAGIWFRQLITWAVIWFGWYVVNKQCNSREKRKELRHAIYSIVSNLDEFEKKVVAYHTSDARDRELASDIRLSINRIISSIMLLKSSGLTIDNKVALQLRQSVTLKNFDSSKHEKQSLRGEILQDVAYAKDQVVQALEKAFSKCYH